MKKSILQLIKYVFIGLFFLRPVMLTAAESNKPLVLAHYMPWYSSKSFSGFWGWHWTMNHFDPEKTNASSMREVASHEYPVLGAYDNADPLVIRTHLAMMKMAGIDGVIVDWYGTKGFWDYGTIHSNTLKLIEGVKRSGMKFIICYEDRTLFHMTDNKVLPAGGAVEHAAEVMKWVEKNWFKDKAYVQYQGRPVFMNYGPEFLTEGQWEIVLKAFKKRPWFLVHELTYLQKSMQGTADAAFSWTPMHLKNAGGVLELSRLNEFNAEFAQRSKEWPLSIPSVSPCFNDIYAQAQLHGSYGYLDKNNGETLRSTLDAALKMNPAVIQLQTWNDWGEGTGIEPTREYGYTNLQIIHNFINKNIRALNSTEAGLTLPQRIFEEWNKNLGDTAALKKLDEIFNFVEKGEFKKAEAAATSL